MDDNSPLIKAVEPRGVYAAKPGARSSLQKLEVGVDQRTLLSPFCQVLV